MDLSILLKKHSHRNKPLWETADVRLARAQRNEAERTCLADRTPGKKLLRNEAAKNLKTSIHYAVTKFELLLANNQDAKPFWHYVKSKQKSKNSIGPLVKDKIGNVTEDAAERAELQSDFFSSVFTNEDQCNIPFATPRTTEELISLTFTPKLVGKCLAKTKNFAAVGPDNFPYIALKVGGSTLLAQLCQLFQLCLDPGTLPLQWRVAHVVPIFKKVTSEIR